MENKTYETWKALEIKGGRDSDWTGHLDDGDLEMDGGGGLQYIIPNALFSKKIITYKTCICRIVQ